MAAAFSSGSRSDHSRPISLCVLTSHVIAYKQIIVGVTHISNTQCLETLCFVPYGLSHLHFDLPGAETWMVELLYLSQGEYWAWGFLPSLPPSRALLYTARTAPHCSDSPSSRWWNTSFSLIAILHLIDPSLWSAAVK